MGDTPINPLDTDGTPNESLPAPEPMQAPVPEHEREAPAAPTAPSNGSHADGALSPQAIEAALAAISGGAPRRTAPGPIIGDVRQLATIQHDVEQAGAEITATRRAVQLLALSIGALAILAAFYAVRGLRAGQSGGGAA